MRRPSNVAIAAAAITIVATMFVGGFHADPGRASVPRCPRAWRPTLSPRHLVVGHGVACGSGNGVFVLVRHLSDAVQTGWTC